MRFFNKFTLVFQSTAVLTVLLLTACEAASSSVSATQTLSTNSTANPPTQETVQVTATGDPTQTPVPIGRPENPVVLGFVTIDDPDSTDQPAMEAAVEVAAQMTGASGYTVIAMEYSNYADALDDLNQFKLHGVWMQPMTYLYAHQRNLADIALLTRHFGEFLYGTQFIANRSSGALTHFDPDLNQNTSEAPEALTQFSGQRPCWTEIDSISGFILPAGLLAENDVDVSDGVIARTHAGVVRALYAGDICDFGATYSILSNPLTSPSFSDLPGLQDQVIVIWRSDPVIPTLNFSFHPDLPAGIRRSITDALLKLSAEDGGAELLSRASGYEITGLQEFDDSVYDPLRSAVELTGTLLSKTIGK